jgi:FkbM family methyltransferase
MSISDYKYRFAAETYGLLQKLRRLYWNMVGGRNEVVFGERFRFEPSTQFPSFRRLRFPPGEIFSTIVRYGDYVQTHSAYLFLDDLEDAPVVVDVGAHHGAYAILLGKVVQKKKGIIVAVEPNPSAFKILTSNVRKNNLEDIVKCESAAIVERSGTFQFIENLGQSRIVQSISPAAFTVEGIPLSSLLKKYSFAYVDLLIIDVEGAELNVLRSIDWTECRFAKIFCELHPYNWKHFGYSGHDMTEFLVQHNFRCFDMYLREHKEFIGDAYIGPTLLISDHDR